MKRRNFLKSSVAAAATMATVQAGAFSGMPWIPSQPTIEAIYILESVNTVSSTFAHALAYQLAQEAGVVTVERVSVAELVSAGMRPESVYVGATLWSDWELFSVIAGAKTTLFSRPLSLGCGADRDSKNSALELSGEVKNLLLGRREQGRIEALPDAEKTHAGLQPGMVFACQLS